MATTDLQTAGENGNVSKLEGPVMLMMSKRLRALRKKMNRIVQIEETKAAGKVINKEQEEALNSKPNVSLLIEEYEKLREPLISALHEEIEFALKERDELRAASDIDLRQDSSPESVLLHLLYVTSLLDATANIDPEHASQERASLLEDPGSSLTADDLESVAKFGRLIVSRNSEEQSSHRCSIEGRLSHLRKFLDSSQGGADLVTGWSYAKLRDTLGRIVRSEYFVGKQAEETGAETEVEAQAPQPKYTEGEGHDSTTAEGGEESDVQDQPDNSAPLEQQDTINAPPAQFLSPVETLTDPPSGSLAPVSTVAEAKPASGLSAAGSAPTVAVTLPLSAPQQGAGLLVPAFAPQGGFSLVNVAQQQQQLPLQYQQQHVGVSTLLPLQYSAPPTSLLPSVNGVHGTSATGAPASASAFPHTTPAAAPVAQPPAPQASTAAAPVPLPPPLLPTPQPQAPVLPPNSAAVTVPMQPGFPVVTAPAVLASLPPPVAGAPFAPAAALPYGAAPPPVAGTVPVAGGVAPGGGRVGRGGYRGRGGRGGYGGRGRFGGGRGARGGGAAGAAVGQVATAPQANGNVGEGSGGGLRPAGGGRGRGGGRGGGYHRGGPAAHAQYVPRGGGGAAKPAGVAPSPVAPVLP